MRRARDSKRMDLATIKGLEGRRERLTVLFFPLASLRLCVFASAHSVPVPARRCAWIAILCAIIFLRSAVPRRALAKKRDSEGVLPVTGLLDAPCFQATDEREFNRRARR